MFSDEDNTIDISRLDHATAADGLLRALRLLAERDVRPDAAPILHAA
jgi:hypothetical protein